MRSLSSAIHTARNLLSQAKGWLLFVEIPRKAGGFYRLVGNGLHVAGDSKVWQAASIAFVLPEESLEGGHAAMSISVSNVSRLPLAEVEVNNEVLGQSVTCWLQHEANLASFAPALSWKQTALRAAATEKAMSVECGAPGTLLRVPLTTFTRDKWPQLSARAGVSL